MLSIIRTIAQELNVRPGQVEAAVGLLDGGATVPFIARYRKEVTEGLDDTQLRNLEERLAYLREMEERRAAILKSIEEQGKLTPELKTQIVEADTKARLEDLYLPYKPRRVTKGMLAREAGIEPLADALLADPTLVPDTEAQKFLNAEKNYADSKAVLDGAKHILMERFAENADLLEKLRTFMTDNAEVVAKVVAGKENEGAKFRDYFEHREPLKAVPSHRALAMFRGRNEGVLTLALEMPGQEEATAAGQPHPAEGMIAGFAGIRNEKRAADAWLQEVVRWTWRVKLLTHLETDLLGDIKGSAEEEAIKVFADNLKDLLMAAPAGPRATLGL
ncbi:MAG TPA: Tex-like N-terminal domain-containing protein, partial [Moraxellaceae bacterium]